MRKELIKIAKATLAFFGWFAVVVIMSLLMHMPQELPLMLASIALIKTLMIQFSEDKRL